MFSPTKWLEGGSFFVAGFAGVTGARFSWEIVDRSERVDHNRKAEGEGSRLVSLGCRSPPDCWRCMPALRLRRQLGSSPKDRLVLPQAVGTTLGRERRRLRARDRHTARYSIASCSRSARHEPLLKFCNSDNLPEGVNSVISRIARSVIRTIDLRPPEAQCPGCLTRKTSSALRPPKIPLFPIMRRRQPVTVVLAAALSAGLVGSADAADPTMSGARVAADEPAVAGVPSLTTLAPVAEGGGGRSQPSGISDGARETLASYGGSSVDLDPTPEQLLALLPDGRGQSKTSMDELDLVLGQRQIFTDLRTLQDRILDAQRPTANAVIRHSVQSDHLDIDQAELSQDLFFSQGRSQLRLAVQAIDYDPRVGDSVTQHAIGLTGNQRINDIAAVTGEFWLNQLRSEGSHDTKGTYDAFLTLRPNDSLRLDFDTSRRLFDNITSLRLGLTVTSYGGSIDFTPTDGLRLTARGTFGSYSDGNRRRNEEVEGVWRIRSQPVVIEIGALVTNFHFQYLFSNGYFNPRNYVSGAGMFRVQSSLTSRLTAELAGSAGIEHADPGGSKPLLKGSIELAYKIFKRWSIDADLAHFSSRQSTSSGFSRTTATLGLHYRF